MTGRGENTGRHAVTFLLQHLAIGCFDVFGLGAIVLNSSSPGLALFLLFFGLFVTFGSLGMAVAVMNLGQERDSDPIE